MRPGGSTPDRALVTPSNGRRITAAGKRSRNLERRFLPGASGGVYKVTQKLDANAASVVFDSIDQSFTTLELRWAAAAVDSTEEQILLARFNDAAASGDYHWHVTAPGGVGDATDVTSATFNSTYAGLGFLSCDDDGYTDFFSTGVVHFPDYTDTVAASIGYHGNGGAGVPESLEPDAWLSNGYRTDAGPLTKIELFAAEVSGAGFATEDFKAGCRFTLLGF